MKNLFSLLLLMACLPAVAMEERETKKQISIKLVMTQEEQDKRTKKLATILTLIQQYGTIKAKSKKSAKKPNLKKLWKKARHQILQGADVNTTTNFKNTALILAAEYGKQEIALLLLNNGAHVNAENDIHLTALECAQTNNHTDMVELLTRRGACEDIQNKTNSNSTKKVNFAD